MFGAFNVETITRVTKQGKGWYIEIAYVHRNPWCAR